MEFERANPGEPFGVKRPYYSHTDAPTSDGHAFFFNSLYRL